MADRCDFHFRQRVSEAELDIAFELLEKADRNLAADVNTASCPGRCRRRIPPLRT